MRRGRERGTRRQVRGRNKGLTENLYDGEKGRGKGGRGEKSGKEWRMMETDRKAEETKTERREKGNQE